MNTNLHDFLKLLATLDLTVENIITFDTLALSYRFQKEMFKRGFAWSCCNIRFKRCINEVTTLKLAKTYLLAPKGTVNAVNFNIIGE